MLLDELLRCCLPVWKGIALDMLEVEGWSGEIQDDSFPLVFVGWMCRDISSIFGSTSLASC